MPESNGYNARLPRRTHISQWSRDDFALYRAMGIGVGPVLDDQTVSVRLPEGLRIVDTPKEDIVQLVDGEGGVRCDIVRPSLRCDARDVRREQHYVDTWHTRFSAQIEFTRHVPTCNEVVRLVFSDRAKSYAGEPFETISRYDCLTMHRVSREFFEAQGDIYARAAEFRGEMQSVARRALKEVFPACDDPAAYWNDPAPGGVADVRQAFAEISARMLGDRARREGIAFRPPGSRRP